MYLVLTKSEPQSMDIQFIKLHSCGRDFILLDTIKNTSPEENTRESLSKAISHRYFGVGAFGFLILNEGTEAPIEMQMFESDGIESEPGPDALLCCARYAFDAGLLGTENSHIQAQNHNYHVEMIDNESIMVELGPPYHWQDSQELKEQSNLDVDETITVGNKDCTITPLDFYGLHSVVFDTDSPFNLSRVGRRLARHPAFSHPPMVELVRVYSREELKVRVWSSDSGELYSSAAGDSAAVVASVIHGFTDRDVLVHNKGGDIFVKWEEIKNHIFVTSSVEYSFIGTFYWDTEEESLG